MTTYYVDADRPNDSGDGLTEPTAKKTIGAGVTVAAADGSTPHTINIANGTYAETVVLTGANLTGMILQGASRTNTIVTSPTDHTVLILDSAPSGTLQGMTLQVGVAKNAIFKQPAATGWTFEDVLFESLPTHTSQLFRSFGGAGLNISKCRFRFQYSAANPLLLAGDTGGTVSYCQFSAGATSHFSNAVVSTSSGDVNFYNNAFLDTYQFGLAMSGSGTLTAVNNVIQGGSIGASSVCLLRTNGTLNADQNFLISGTANSAGWVSAGVTEGTGDNANYKTNVNPRFLNYRRRGCILIRVDDTGGLAYAQDVASAISPYGFEATWYLNPSSVDPGDLPAVRTLVEGGTMEIGCHGYTHTRLTVTGTVFTVTMGGKTITTNRDADTITLSGGGGTVTGFRAKTLAVIKTELEGLGATVTPSGIYGSGGIRTESLGEAFDDGAANNVLEILHDYTAATGIEKVEIVDGKALLTADVNDAGAVTDGQTGDTYICNTFGFAYNDSDSDLQDAVRVSGFWAAQSSVAYATLTTVKGPDMFNVGGVGAPFLSLNEADTRIAARAIAFAAAQTGFVYFVLAHNAGEISIEQWGWICEEWALFGDSIRVTSMQLFAEEVRDSGNWTDNGDGTYTRSPVYGYSDLHLRGNSPCIDAGADVGLTSDADDVAVPLGAAPDIGAYESTPTFIPARLLPILPYPGPQLVFEGVVDVPTAVGTTTGVMRVVPRISGSLRIEPRASGRVRVEPRTSGDVRSRVL